MTKQVALLLIVPSPPICHWESLFSDPSVLLPLAFKSDFSFFQAPLPGFSCLSLDGHTHGPSCWVHWGELVRRSL